MRDPLACACNSAAQQARELLFDGGPLGEDRARAVLGNMMNLAPCV